MVRNITTLAAFRAVNERVSSAQLWTNRTPNLIPFDFFTTNRKACLPVPPYRYGTALKLRVLASTAFRLVLLKVRTVSIHFSIDSMWENYVTMKVRVCLPFRCHCSEQKSAWFGKYDDRDWRWRRFGHSVSDFILLVYISAKAAMIWILPSSFHEFDVTRTFYILHQSWCHLKQTSAWPRLMEMAD